MKLKVEVGVKDKVVSVRIAEQDEGLRCNSFLHRASDGFEIRSSCCPEIRGNCLYIRGWDKLEDSEPKKYMCYSNQKAVELASRIVRAVEEINNLKPKVKEMTVAEVAEELGYEVKIVRDIEVGSLVRFHTVNKRAVAIDYSSHFEEGVTYCVEQIEGSCARINGWYVEKKDLYLV